MSRANAQVKFPDGTIKHGIYNGTVDVFWQPLFPDNEIAWNAWDEYYKNISQGENKWLNPFDDNYYDVEIADDYGSGTTYIGKASKSQIVGAFVADEMIKVKSGLPEWWAK